MNIRDMCRPIQPHLWVDAQRPPPALVHGNAVVGGKVVLGYAPDVPLPNLCRTKVGGVWRDNDALNVPLIEAHKQTRMLSMHCKQARM